ncbi:hypothetical protein EK21DRAFT_111198 [Setomelanomma holmii]|uniref:Uncharacterized protein n=1 Tax=Setomelanomma holmii TaxID=210430 RepID=A0A9P4HBF8_9PLEO|nr:hypothetical protein EK21DRAFT_111198 [Setomelanomma holmii]
MRVLAAVTLVLAVITSSSTLIRHTHTPIGTLSCGPTASPPSRWTAESLKSTPGATVEDLELRQAPGLAPNPAPASPANPADAAVPEAAPAAPIATTSIDQSVVTASSVNPAAVLANPITPVVPPAANPGVAVPAAAQIAPVIASAALPVVPWTTTTAITTTLLTSASTTGDFVTTQWLETWIGGTSQTWVPHTITFHFQAMMTSLPPPGSGEIGMGTLTGKTGQTQTVVVGLRVGAAYSQTPKWMEGVVAAVGAGIAGMVL